MSEKRMNAGYEIISSLQLGEDVYGSSSEIVMGKRNSQVSPYVTWRCFNGDSYEHGNYFESKERAMQDFFERGLERAGVDLRAAYREETALGDIEMALSEEFSSKQAEDLMKNDRFTSLAIRRYDKIDHSVENEALQELLADCYKDLVKRREIFGFDLIENVQDRETSVFKESGEAIKGKVSFATNDYLCVEISSLENEKAVSVIVRPDEVKSVEVENGKSFCLKGNPSLDNRIMDAGEKRKESAGKSERGVEKEVYGRG